MGLSTEAVWGGIGITLLGVWALPSIFTKKCPWKIIEGADGRRSTSKFQFLVWTTVMMFAYVALFIERCTSHNYAPIDDIPRNVLLAMGFSGTTLAAAKAITSGYVASGRVSKTANGSGGVLTDDDGQSDLAKTQLVGWTVIGVIVYLVSVFHADPSKGLPDIDGALMVLLGLGHGAYIGKKLVTTDTPQILSVTSLTRPGQSVIITGFGFGAQVGTVLADDHALIGVPLGWEDTKISFVLPLTHPNGSS